MRRMVLSLSCLLVACDVADAQFRRGAPTRAISKTCPMGNADPNDGCVNAPVDGAFQKPNFFTSYAPQNGQGYGGRRPPWNVAGVDYPVGNSASVTLKSAKNNANLPNGCTYNGVTFVVTCQTVSDLTIEGLDFGDINSPGSGSVNGVCVRLFINPTVSGKLTIRNSRFVNGSGGGQKCNVNGPLVTNNGLNTGITEILVEKNWIDGGADQYANDPTSPNAMLMPNVFQINTSQPNVPVTVRYNAVFHANARVFSFQTDGFVDLRYNYGEGWSYLPGAEFTGQVSPAGTLTVSAMSGATLGPIVNGMALFGAGVLPNTHMTFSSGTPGGAGTYALDLATFTTASEAMSGRQPIHGEVLLTARTTPNAMTAGAYQSYNTFLQPNNAPGQAVTAFIFAATGNTVGGFNFYSVDHNVGIVNQTSGTNAMSFIFEAGYDVFDNLRFENNWMDPAGATNCLTYSNAKFTVNAATNFHLSGNVNLRDGSTVDLSTCNFHG